MKIELAKEWLEHSPEAKPTPVTGLVGFWQPEEWMLCNTCAGRLIGRGCRVDGIPIWNITGPGFCGACDKVLESHP